MAKGRNKRGGRSDTGLTAGEWYKWVMGIGVLVTTITGAVLGISGVFKIGPWDEPDRSIPRYVELVLDTSTAMSGGFGSSTRWQAARTEIEQSVMDGGKEDRVAFRVSGGECAGKNTSLLLGFEKDRARAISRRFDKLSPAGKSTFVSGVAQAVSDLETKRKVGKPQDLTLLVVTAGGDECRADIVPAMTELQTRIKQADMRVIFRFIGMGLDARQKAQIESAAKEVDGKAVYVSNDEELARALKHFVAIEPILSNAREIFATQNAVVKQMNQVVDALNHDDPKSAELALKQVRETIDQTNAPYSDLAHRQQTMEVTEIYRLVGENRDEYRQFLPLCEQLIRHQHDKDATSYAKVVDELNSRTNKSNQRTNEMTALVRTLEKSTAVR
jgi:hypothetical protein